MTSVSTAVGSSSEFDKATDTRFIGQCDNVSIYAGAADSTWCIGEVPNGGKN
ncbi:hypothetical protein CU097_011913 [Rhizopus azygosporus]|uniref:Uncharacterized protein n=1 Tax=Rhizopus azygosporus TaxID=86630 RepID=A0A367K2H5_RHIAZ|nr:hypothetical protein CU097_011913 [Rhizopus azygosporus]